MKTLRGLGIIFFCLVLGVISRSLIDFPIPEVVYGMMYLLIFLLFGVVKVDQVEDVSNALLENLAFLFVPITVSLMDQMGVLGENIVPIIVITIVSLFLTMGVTAKVVEFIQKVRDKK
ncbi:MAG: CidA/LrgA family protein [Tissierellia bacterium]|nr:CidA/LrgA family protein [Tissierellia bacterium]